MIAAKQSTATHCRLVSRGQSASETKTEFIRLYKQLSALDKVKILCYIEGFSSDAENQGSVIAEQTKSLKAQFCTELLDMKDDDLSSQDRLFKLILRIHMKSQRQPNDDFWAALYDSVEQRLSEITCDYEPIKGL